MKIYEMAGLKPAKGGGYRQAEPFALPSNGGYTYHSVAGDPGAESITARMDRERFWRSLRKQIQKGARV